MLVIGLTEIRVTFPLRRTDFSAQVFHPFRPSEMTSLVELEYEREGAGLPRLPEHRPFFVHRQRRQALALRNLLHGRSSTGIGVHVVVPEVDIETVPIRSLAAPELACGKAHAVDMLRLVAFAMGARVGEGEDPTVALDRAVLAAYVARQARVTDRIDVADGDYSARPKAWRHMRVNAAGRPRLQQPIDLIHPERRHPLP